MCWYIAHHLKHDIQERTRIPVPHDHWMEMLVKLMNMETTTTKKCDHFHLHSTESSNLRRFGHSTRGHVSIRGEADT